MILGSPVTRWASVAFGAGLGIGSAYTECSLLFNDSSAKTAAPKATETPVTETPVAETPTPQVQLILHLI